MNYNHIYYNYSDLIALNCNMLSKFLFLAHPAECGFWQRTGQRLGLCGWESTHLKKAPNNPIKHIISFSTQELNQLSESSQVRESERSSVYSSAAAVNKTKQSFGERAFRSWQT